MYSVRTLHQDIIALWLKGGSISQTAKTLKCSESTVLRVSKEPKKRIGRFEERSGRYFGPESESLTVMKKYITFGCIADGYL